MGFVQGEHSSPLCLWSDTTWSTGRKARNRQQICSVPGLQKHALVVNGGTFGGTGNGEYGANQSC